MRIAVSVAAGILLAALGGATGPASAAPAFAPIASQGGSNVEQVRLTHRHRYRRTGRRVMGLPTPGTRARYRGARVPRI